MAPGVEGQGVRMFACCSGVSNSIPGRFERPAVPTSVSLQSQAVNKLRFIVPINNTARALKLKQQVRLTDGSCEHDAVASRCIVSAASSLNAICDVF